MRPVQTQAEQPAARGLLPLVEQLALCGASVEDIEAEVNPLVPDEERRSALWLYAWHCVESAAPAS